MITHYATVSLNPYGYVSILSSGNAKAHEDSKSAPPAPIGGAAIGGPAAAGGAGGGFNALTPGRKYPGLGGNPCLFTTKYA